MVKPSCLTASSKSASADWTPNPALLYDPAKGQRDRYYALRGGFVHAPAFDPTGFDLPPEQLVDSILEKERRIIEIMGEVKAILQAVRA